MLECWKCGAVGESTDWVDMWEFGGRSWRIHNRIKWRPRRCAPGLGRHDHREPPTPDELVDAGWQVLTSINQMTIDALT